MLTHCVCITAIEAITTLKEPPACHSAEFCGKNMRQLIMLATIDNAIEIIQSLVVMHRRTLCLNNPLLKTERVEKSVCSARGCQLDLLDVLRLNANCVQRSVVCLLHKEHDASGCFQARIPVSVVGEYAQLLHIFTRLAMDGTAWHMDNNFTIRQRAQWPKHQCVHFSSANSNPLGSSHRKMKFGRDLSSALEVFERFLK